LKIPRNLASEIISRYRQEDLPCLSDTLLRLSRLNPESESAFEELSGIILEDMGLTGKVIRTVNSVYYRRCGQEITTITQALVLLGFETVRKIAMNMAVLDLAEKSKNDPLVSLILSSFTAAFLAQDILDPEGVSTGESVFVTGLFHCLGRIILCLHQSKLYEALAAKESEGEAQRKAVEAFFSDLGRGFGELWGLPQSMINSMEGSQTFSDPESKVIDMCHLAIRSVLTDSGSELLPRVIDKIAREISSSSEGVVRKISQAFDTSLSLSTAFKTRASLKRIKTISKRLDRSNGYLGVSSPKGGSGNVEGISRFLGLLTNLTSIMVQKRFGLDKVYLLAAEALLRGVEMERVILSLLTVDKRWLRPRYAIGKSTEGVKAGLEMAYPPRNQDVACCFEHNQIRTLNWHIITGKKGLTDQIWLQGQVCLAPIVVNQKSIGCFLLDRPVSKGDILPEDILMVTAVRDLVVLATQNR